MVSRRPACPLDSRLRGNDWFDSLPHPYDQAGKVFEAYVQNRTPGAYRLFWCYGPDKNQITILAMTPHP